MIKKIDHIGIAVESIEQALDFYQKKLGLPPSPIEEIPTEKVKVVLLKVGESRIELLEPTSPESPVAKFLQKRKPGIHHIAFEVDHLDPFGFSPVKAGAENSKICFIHPKEAHGVLIELVEHKK